MVVSDGPHRREFKTNHRIIDATSSKQIEDVIRSAYQRHLITRVSCNVLNPKMLQLALLPLKSKFDVFNVPHRVVVPSELVGVKTSVLDLRTVVELLKLVHTI